MKGTFFGHNKGTEVVAKRKVEQEDNTETDPAPQSSYSTPSPAKKPRRTPNHHTMSHHPSNLSLNGLSIGEDQDDIPEAILHLEPIQVCGHQTDTVLDPFGNFLGSATTIELRFYVDQCMEDEDLEVDWADDDTTTTVIVARKYPKVITDLTNNDDFILDVHHKPIYLKTSQMIRTMATNQQAKRKEETTSILSTAKSIGSITFNRDMDRETLDYNIHELEVTSTTSGKVAKSCLAVVVNAKIQRDKKRRTRTKKTRKKVSLSRGESNTIPTATATATATAAAADAAANEDNDDAMGVSLNGTADLPTPDVTVNHNATDDMSAISGLETPTGNVPGVYDARYGGNRSRGRSNSPRRGENRNSGSGVFDRSRSRSRCRSRSREPKSLFIDGKATEILTGSRHSSAKKRSNDDMSQSDY